MVIVQLGANNTDACLSLSEDKHGLFVPRSHGDKGKHLVRGYSGEGLCVACVCVCTDDVLKALSPTSTDNEAEANKRKATLDQHDSIVEQYKGLIREQVYMHLQLTYDCSYPT